MEILNIWLSHIYIPVQAQNLLVGAVLRQLGHIQCDVMIVHALVEIRHVLLSSGGQGANRKRRFGNEYQECWAGVVYVCTNNR